MKIWETFLCELEQDLGKDVVDKWLRPLRVAGFDAGNIYLDSPDAFQIEWFKQHIAQKAKNRLISGRGKPINIHLRTKQKKKKHEETPSLPEFVADSLEPDATIENLIVDEKNLAHKLITNLDLGSFNPITICGPEGSGKTHLLMGVAHMLRDKKVRYVKAVTFTEQVVRAFRFGGILPFREIYRDLDVLLIDDIHFLARKWATQEEFFHTFNQLHTAGKQIILTSNRLPTALEDIEQRLVSRFEWGITVPTTPPDLFLLATRHLDRHSLPHTLTNFLIETFPYTKPLIQAITALSLRCTSPPTVETAKEILKDLIEAESKTPLTPEQIVHVVAREFDISEKEIIGKGQKKELAIARQLAMYLCRKKLNLPFTHIGRFFKRDHSTVMSSVKLVDRDLEKEGGTFTSPINEILKSL